MHMRAQWPLHVCAYHRAVICTPGRLVHQACHRSGPCWSSGNRRVTVPVTQIWPLSWGRNPLKRLDRGTGTVPALIASDEVGWTSYRMILNSSAPSGACRKREEKRGAKKEKEGKRERKRG